MNMENWKISADNIAEHATRAPFGPVAFVDGACFVLREMGADESVVALLREAAAGSFMKKYTEIVTTKKCFYCLTPLMDASGAPSPINIPGQNETRWVCGDCTK